MEAVIFIGVPAAGKSSFYKTYFFTTHIRINLDMLKTRHREDILLAACITAKQRFVVDNTNILMTERAKYINLAKAAGFPVFGYFFPTHLEDALKRNTAREGRAKIPEKAIIGMHRRLQIPTLAEGFDQLYDVTLIGNNEFDIQKHEV
ncbi:MAG: AAA family ATPase [Anaerolineae bacterium]|nr:AAA family ATPase [Anaerolineae bacterium]